LIRVRHLAALLPLALALPAVHASSGVVIDPKGQPVADVQVCYVGGDVDLMCVTTVEDGRWAMPSGKLDRVRLSHPGYLPLEIAGGAQSEPVMLAPAAILSVRLEDTAGSPITEGEVEVLLTSGKRYGPFPIRSEEGTIVNSLDPGPVVILARSKGFIEARAAENELPPGQKTSVVVRLEPAPQKDQ
jgi:hypothetical protein